MNFVNAVQMNWIFESVRTANLFWYFIVTANCLLLGADVLIVMGALQIYIDDDDD